MAHTGWDRHFDKTLKLEARTIVIASSKWPLTVELSATISWLHELFDWSLTALNRQEQATNQRVLHRWALMLNVTR